jgi:hypothetical protein
MHQHDGKKYPTLAEMVGVMRKKFGPRTMREIVQAATAEVQQRDEPSADYPLGGLIEPYDIEREKELTD